MSTFPPVRTAADLDADAVFRTARHVRFVLELVWPGWREASRIPAPDRSGAISEGCCIHAAFVLAEALRAGVPGPTWAVSGGHPTDRTPRGGFTDAAGETWQHCWVTGAGPDLPGEPLLIADVTADQFGGEPVAVATVPHPAYLANTAPRTIAAFGDNEQELVEMVMQAVRAAAHLMDGVRGDAG